MDSIPKRVFAILGGLIVGMIIIGLTEGLGEFLFSPPILLWLILAWAIGAFAGGFVATMIGKELGPMPAYTVGGILSLSGILNIVMLSYPLWLWVGILIFIPAAWVGWKVAIH